MQSWLEHPLGRPIMSCRMDDSGRTGVALDADGTLVGVERGVGVTWSALVPDHPVSLVLPPGGELVAVSTRMGSVHVFALDGQLVWSTQLKRLGEQRSAWVAVNATGNRVVAVNGGKVVELYDMLGAPLGKVKAKRKVIRAYPRPQSRGFFLIHDDGGVSAVTEDGKQVWRVRCGESTEAIGWTEEVERIVLGGMDNRVSCLTSKGERIWQVEVPRPVSRIALADRGLHMLVGMAGGRTLLLDDSRIVRSETSDTSLVDLKVTRDERFLAVHQRGLDEIPLQTTEARRALWTLPNPIDRILAANVAKDGGSVLLGTKDGTLIGLAL